MVSGGRDTRYSPLPLFIASCAPGLPALATPTKRFQGPSSALPSFRHFRWLSSPTQFFLQTAFYMETCFLTNSFGVTLKGKQNCMSLASRGGLRRLANLKADVLSVPLFSSNTDCERLKCCLYFNSTSMVRFTEAHPGMDLRLCPSF